MEKSMENHAFSWRFSVFSREFRGIWARFTLRSLLFLAFGSVFAGMAPWLLLGAILGEMMIGLALQLCQATFTISTWFMAVFSCLWPISAIF